MTEKLTFKKTQNLFSNSRFILNSANQLDALQAIISRPITVAGITGIKDTMLDTKLDTKLDTMVNTMTDSSKDVEARQVNRLITLFNHTFAHLNTVLVRGDGEPEYFPAQYLSSNTPALTQNAMPAQIVFAHGFFASALHEISHWCIAGKHRRTLPDFGYWYAPDGRSEAQQRAFEQVEIKPQALECLFNLACNRQFSVSQDNLFADFDTSQSHFEQDVYKQVIRYLNQPQTLPRDAKQWITRLVAAQKIDWFNVG